MIVVTGEQDDVVLVGPPLRSCFELGFKSSDDAVLHHHYDCAKSFRYMMKKEVTLDDMAR